MGSGRGARSRLPPGRRAAAPRRGVPPGAHSSRVPAPRGSAFHAIPERARDPPASKLNAPVSPARRAKDCPSSRAVRGRLTPSAAPPIGKTPKFRADVRKAHVSPLCAQDPLAESRPSACSSEREGISRPLAVLRTRPATFGSGGCPRNRRSCPSKSTAISGRDAVPESTARASTRPSGAAISGSALRQCSSEDARGGVANDPLVGPQAQGSRKGEPGAAGLEVLQDHPRVFQQEVRVGVERGRAEGDEVPHLKRALGLGRRQGAPQGQGRLEAARERARERAPRRAPERARTRQGDPHRSRQGGPRDPCCRKATFDPGLHGQHVGERVIQLGDVASVPQAEGRAARRGEGVDGRGVGGRGASGESGPSPPAATSLWASTVSRARSLAPEGQLATRAPASRPRTALAVRGATAAAVEPRPGRPTWPRLGRRPSRERRRKRRRDRRRSGLPLAGATCLLPLARRRCLPRPGRPPRDLPPAPRPPRPAPRAGPRRSRGGPAGRARAGPRGAPRPRGPRPRRAASASLDLLDDARDGHPALRRDEDRALEVHRSTLADEARGLEAGVLPSGCGASFRLGSGRDGLLQAAPARVLVRRQSPAPVGPRPVEAELRDLRLEAGGRVPDVNRSSASTRCEPREGAGDRGAGGLARGALRQVPLPVGRALEGESEARSAPGRGGPARPRKVSGEKRTRPAATARKGGRWGPPSSRPENVASRRQKLTAAPSRRASSPLRRRRLRRNCRWRFRPGGVWRKPAASTTRAATPIAARPARRASLRVKHDSLARIIHEAALPSE